MQAVVRAEPNELIGELTRMVRLAAQMLTTASIALHQADPTLAAPVITDRDRLRGTLKDTERRALTLLTSQAPLAADLRVIIATLRAVDHLQRMSELAGYIARIAQLKHPNPMTCSQLRPVLARMSLLASQQAEDTATAIEDQNPLRGARRATDNELDAQLAHLFSILSAQDWSHHVGQAINAALIGRHYERFAAHAVAIAGQARYLTTGQAPKPTTLPAAGGPAR